MSVDKGRDVSIDIAKGIAILLVIVGHCVVMPREAVHLIYSFHMPLFFIFAGYFYHEKEIEKSLKYDFKRLMVPYVVFACIYAVKFSFTDCLKGEYEDCVKRWIIALWGCGGTHETSYFFSNITDIGIIWFLPALYWAKNMYNMVYSMIKNKVCLFIVVVMLAVSATYCSNKLINMPLGILTGISAMLFYAIGNYVSMYKGRLNALYCVPILLIAWIVDLKYGGFSMDACIYKFYPLDVIGACGGTFFIYLLSTVIKKTDCLSSFLKWCGKISMVIFCMHYIAQLVDINTRLDIQQWYLWLMIDFAMILPMAYACTKLELTKKIFQIR